MNVNLRKLSTKELAALCQRTITVSDETAFAVVTDNPLLLVVKTIYNDYDAVYIKKTYSGKSELLFKYDLNRNNYLGGIKSILRGHSKLTTSPYYQEATDLYEIFKKYAEETAQLKKLIDELELPQNKAKIETMLLSEMVTQFKAAQTEFEEFFNEMAGENSELRMQESASSMRDRLEDALRNYFNVIKAMKNVPGWKELYAKLDEVIKSVNSRITKPKANEVK